MLCACSDMEMLQKQVNTQNIRKRWTAHCVTDGISAFDCFVFVPWW